MEEIIKKFVGSKVDINCSNGIWFKGVIVAAENGRLELRDDEERLIYIAIDRVVAVYEVSTTAVKPGFLG